MNKRYDSKSCVEVSSAGFAAAVELLRESIVRECVNVLCVFCFVQLNGVKCVAFVAN